MVALLRFALRLPCFALLRVALLRFASRRNQGETPPFDSLPESDLGVGGRRRRGGGGGSGGGGEGPGGVR